MKAEVNEKEEIKNMKTAKLGAMFLISVMALAGIGAGYAAWVDTITIEGTVSTGSVDLVVKDYSGTWVYKVLADDSEITDHKWLYEATYTQTVDLVEVPCTRALADGYLLIAYAYSEQAYETDGTTPIDDAVTMAYGGLLSGVDFVADVLFHYEGTIPVKVNDFGLPIIYGDTEGDWITPLCGLYNGDPTPAIYVVAYRCDANGNPIDENGVVVDPEGPPYPNYEIVSIGTQLHYCNYLLLELHINLPQQDDLMSRTGGFTATVGVVQWNEYPYTP